MQCNCVFPVSQEGAGFYVTSLLPELRASILFLNLAWLLFPHSWDWAGTETSLIFSPWLWSLPSLQEQDPWMLSGWRYFNGTCKQTIPTACGSVRESVGLCLLFPCSIKAPQSCIFTHEGFEVGLYSIERFIPPQPDTDSKWQRHWSHLHLPLYRSGSCIISLWQQENPL